MSETPNAAQIDYWNEGAGQTWAELQALLDRQLQPLGRAIMAALSPRPGERILDIGCGAGETSLELAFAVGPDGAVTGADISRPMLEVARRRTSAANVTFVEADAQTFPFEPGAFDAAFSRFGVMFFADPSAAFANIRRALKAGGRLAFVCWRAPAENPIMTLPMMAAAPFQPAMDPPDPTAPGPFAFADPDRVRRILTEGGFTDVALTPHDEKIGGGDLEAAMTLALRVGPLGRMFRENPDIPRDKAVAAIRQAFTAHDGPEGVKLASATWFVTARAPA
jgi:SAM-dependent methyltransferase